MAQQLESVNERLRYFEKRFQQIASSTGLTNPDAIINKFTLKEEIKKELNQEIQQKERDITEYKASHSQLLQEHSLAKESFVDSKWKDIDALEERLRDAGTGAKKHHTESGRLEQSLAFFQEGLLQVQLARRAPATRTHAHTPTPDARLGHLSPRPTSPHTCPSSHLTRPSPPLIPSFTWSCLKNLVATKFTATGRTGGQGTCTSGR